MGMVSTLIVSCGVEGTEAVIAALAKIDGVQVKLKESTKKTGEETKAQNDKSKLSWASLTTGINQGMELINKAIYAVNVALSPTNDWADYNVAMLKGSIATGLVVDQYSRLIQAADDALIPMESMTTAMEMATKNGYPMTVDSLGQVADKLNGIKNPAEKAKAAMDIFGRGWADIMPFLEQGSEGIDKATAAIKDNMLATEDSVNKSKAYATAVDDVTDAYEGLRNEVGAKAMPVLTDYMNSLLDQSTRSATLKANMDLLKSALADGKITWQEYGAAIIATNLGQEAGIKGTNTLIDTHLKIAEALYASQDAWDVNTRAVEMSAGSTVFLATTVDLATAANKDLGKNVEDVRFSQDKLTASSDLVAASQAEMAAAAVQVTEGFRQQAAAVTSLDKNFGGIIGLAKQFDKSLEEIVKQEKIMASNPIGSEKYDEAKGKVDELKLSMQELANQVVLDMFMATISIGTITKAEADAYFQMAEDMGIISTDAAALATEVYGAAIDQINGMVIDDKTGNVVLEVDDTSVQEYNAPIIDLTLIPDDQQLQDYNPPTFNSTVTLYPDPSEIAAWLKADHFMTVRLIKSGESGQAIGGPVYPGRTYNWQEPGREGELLIPSQYGRVASSTEVAQMLRGAIRPGDGAKGAGGNESQVINNNSYTLTMSTTNNPADVKTAFELMEAWNA